MEYRVEGEMPERAAEEVSSEPACELTAMQKAWKMLREAKKNVRVAVILPPAVRTAIGEYFGLARGEDAFGKVAAAFRMIGADVVADGALAVDYALSEAVQAYLARREEDNLPLIVAPHAQAAEIGERYPGLREKVYGFAPALTLAALLRKYYNAIGDGKKTRVIVVAPAEVETDEEVLVLTTREAAVMLQSAGINVRMLKSSGADVPFVKYSGAGVLPAVSGGLSEAFVRYLLPEKAEEPFKKLEYSGLRGRKNFREAKIIAGGETLSIAVACGEEGVEALAAKIAEGKAYDFAEVSACAGGCVAENGQPFADEMTEKLRAEGIYRLDRHCDMKSADQNDAVAWLESLAAAEPVPEPAEPVYEEEPEPIVEIVEEITEAAEEPIEEETETVEEPVEEVAETTEEPVEEVAEATEEPVEEVAETVEEPVEEVVEAAEESVEEATEPVEEVTEAAEEPIEEVAEPVGEPVEEVAETVEEPIEEVAETTEEPVEEATETAEEPVEEITEATEEPVEEVAETAEEPVEEVVETAEEPVEEVAETTEDSEDVLEEEVPLEELFDESADAAAEETDGATEEETEAVETLETEETIAETAAEEIAATEEAVEEPVEEVAEAVEEPVEEVAETAEEPVEKVAETVEEPVEEVAETVEEPVEEVAETAEEPVKEVTETVAEPVEEVTETTEETEAEASEEEDAEETEGTETAANAGKPAVKEPYHVNLSRKDRRKLKRMKKFRR